MVALTDSGKEALDNVVANLAARRTIPGFVLGATTANGEIYFNSGGYKTLDEPASGTIDQDAVFWICSMTKMIAHIAALQLIDQGKLNVETPVYEYFPQFHNTVVVDNIMDPKSGFKPATNTILVKHLLNFSSGLYYSLFGYTGLGMGPAYSGPHGKDPHSEFFSYIQEGFPGIPLQHEPGKNFAYGYSSDVLGFIAEKITGITLEDYMQKNIFKPLGINASFYLTPDLKDRLFPLYLKSQEGKFELWNNQPGTKILERDPTKISRHLGGVGLYMSLRDYLQLLRHILQIHDGKAQNPILSQETVKKMFIGTLTKAGSDSLGQLFSLMTTQKGFSWSNALGVSETGWPGGRKKGSAFWSGWAGTHFFIDPTTGIAAVYGTQIMSNPSGAFDPDALRGLSEFEQALYAGLDS